MKKFIAGCIAAYVATIYTPTSAIAAVSTEEAGLLKTTLTPMGSERAANKDGTIPAWNGGYATTSSGFKPGERRTDPFAGEKPLYSITAQNVGQYAEKLSDGQVAMFKKYPNYRMDIYPTHRTANAPQWVYDNIYKNATRAKATNGGNSIEGAYGGIPFPIPKAAYEVMWNHNLRWNGEAWAKDTNVYVTSSDGKRFLASSNTVESQSPYYYKDGSAETFKQEYAYLKMITTGPAQKVGEVILVKDPMDQAGVGRQAWQYLTGQRRVRKAPSFAYDTPSPASSGQANFDEIYLFNGAFDRYDWKIFGKKEVYLPYNNNKFSLAKLDSDVMGERFLNPDHVRWELHRAWVVEANLVPGKRHVLPKRRFYVDEDTWFAMLADGWDAKGQLSKTFWFQNIVATDLPGVVAGVSGHYDLQTGSWMANDMTNEKATQIKFRSRWPESYFTPDAMAADGVR
jgi:hypothetical protein